MKWANNKTEKCENQVRHTERSPGPAWTYRLEGVDYAVLFKASYPQCVAERTIPVRALPLQHGQLYLQLLHAGGCLLGELECAADGLLQHEDAVDELRVRCDKSMRILLLQHVYLAKRSQERGTRSSAQL